jgi:predicted Zn-dependent protease
MCRCSIVLLLLLGTLSAQDDSLALKSRQGNQLMAEGKFSEAAAIYTELVRAVPNNPGLLLNLGMAQHMAGQHRPAITNLEAALRLQPGIVPALVMVGSSYLQLGEPAKAVPPLREVATAAPGMKEAHAMLAQAQSVLGRHEESAEHGLRWAELEPASAEAWYGLGVSYGTLANKAMAELERSSPASGYSLALTAWVHAARGNFGGAFHFYREALAKQPDLRGIHTELAVIYQETGHSEWALAEAAKEEALPKLDCKTHALECAFRDGLYRRLLTLSRGTKTAASYYWRSRAWDALAKQAFERLGKLPPSVESHALLARVSREQGRHSESVRLWREALKIRPGDPRLEKDLLISLRLNEDYEAALPIAQKLFKQDPQSGELNYLLGQILLNSRNADDAAPYLETAVRLEPGFLPARASLGLALLQNGEAQEAIPHLEAALPTDTDGSLHFRLARAYQGVGQQELAKKTLARYRQITGEQETRASKLGTDAKITPP